MKILAITTIGWGKPDKESAVHLWRVHRPLEELKKHVDWQIDYQETHIKDLEKYKGVEEFTEEELVKAAEHLGKYDIVFSSYYANPTAFSLLQVVNKRYGTKNILDDDDDMFAIDPHNPVWNKLTDNDVFGMQRMIRNAPYITTTNQGLADVYTEKSEVDGKLYVLPNFISDDYEEYDPENGDKVVIGYFGGSSHYKDLHETGVLPALERIMNKYKHVHFHCVGMPIDHYIPRARLKIIEGVKPSDWTTKLFPELNFDVSIAPLEDTLFARSKSNIKWQESTRMGAAFVASNVGPYAELPDTIAVKVNNTEEAWFKALEKMVTDALARHKLVKAAREELKHWRLEDNWPFYQHMFEAVYNDKGDNHANS